MIKSFSFIGNRDYLQCQQLKIFSPNVYYVNYLAISFLNKLIIDQMRSLQNGNKNKLKWIQKSWVDLIGSSFRHYLIRNFIPFICQNVFTYIDKKNCFIPVISLTYYTLKSQFFLAGFVNFCNLYLDLQIITNNLRKKENLHKSLSSTFQKKSLLFLVFFFSKFSVIISRNKRQGKYLKSSFY